MDPGKRIKRYRGQKGESYKVSLSAGVQQSPASRLSTAHRHRGSEPEAPYLVPVTPPSTTRPVAITKLDSSEARNRAARATSSGRPTSPLSWRLRMVANPS